MFFNPLFICCKLKPSKNLLFLMIAELSGWPSWIILKPKNLRVSNWQSESHLDSIPNSYDVLCVLMTSADKCWQVIENCWSKDRFSEIHILEWKQKKLHRKSLEFEKIKFQRIKSKNWPLALFWYRSFCNIFALQS